MLFRGFEGLVVGYPLGLLAGLAVPCLECLRAIQRAGMWPMLSFPQPRKGGLCFSAYSSFLC